MSCLKVLKDISERDSPYAYPGIRSSNYFYYKDEKWLNPALKPGDPNAEPPTQNPKHEALNPKP